MEAYIHELNAEEKEELVRLVRHDLAIVFNRPPRMTTIDKQYDTPLDAYIEKAKYNVYLRNRDLLTAQRRMLQMNKQEYEAKIACNMGKMQSISNEYVSTLEAEITQLKADNIDLMKQVEVNGKALDLACEIIYEERGVDCPALCYKEYVCNDGNGCNHLDQLYNAVCWKEYFMQQAKGDKDV